MHENEVDVCTKMKTKCIGPKLFDAKCTRLACLLSFASLLSVSLSLPSPDEKLSENIWFVWSKTTYIQRMD